MRETEQQIKKAHILSSLQSLCCIPDVLGWGIKISILKAAGSLCNREGYLFSCPVPQCETRLPGFYAVTLLLLK